MFKLVILFYVGLNITYSFAGDKRSNNYSGVKITDHVLALTPTASFLGTHSSERVGYHLHSAGDVNGDGYADFLIGSFHNETFGKNAGAVYLILGKDSEKWGYNISLTSANARFLGGQSYDAVGYYIGGNGDINGDGFDDILIGAPAGDSVPENPGYLYIIFGKVSPDWGYDFILSTNADASFEGENQGDLAGLSAAIIGDMNGDGYDDFICGAPYNDYDASNAGKVYLILGKSYGWYRGIDLSEADVSFYGTNHDGLVGYSVDGVGDVNGDDVPDIAIGARGESKVYLIFGRRNVDWDNNYDINKADVIFYGEQQGAWTGWRVSKAGDVNGNGCDDFLIGAPMYSQGGTGVGKVYLIFGRNHGWNGNLAEADASYIGEARDDQAGWDVQDAGDVDGDGYDDFLIGAWLNDSNGEDSGEIYLIRGKSSGWQRNVLLSQIEDSFMGENSGDYVGFSVSSAGDINGDYRKDIIVSAPFNNDGGSYAGKVYLFLSDYSSNQIGGRTIYYANNRPVQNVTLTLAGDNSEIVFSNLNGQYILNVPQGNNFSVTPSKQTYTDISKNHITIYDAALTAFHTVHLDTLDTLAQLAADVDLDEQITINDAALIASFAVNLPLGSESHVGEWKFNPEKRDYKRSDLPSFNQDYSCILLGEVSGNWDLDTHQIILTKNILQNLKMSSEGIVRIPITIDSNLSMISAEIHLTFDPVILEFIGANKAEMTKDFQIIYNRVNLNKLIVGLYGLPAIEKAGKIMSIDFKVIGNLKEESRIQFEKFQINNYSPLKFEAILNCYSSYKKYNELEYNLLRIYPNPFNPYTVIEYQLNMSTNINLTIVNILGNEVKTIDSGYKQPGSYKFVWSGEDNSGEIVSSGIYICHLKCDKYSYKKKIIKLK